MSIPRTESAGEYHSLLCDQPIFRFMPDEVRDLVADSFVPEVFPFGSVIVREGDEADAFYVIAAGTARALKRGEHGEDVPLNVMRSGDSFGELGLLEETRRTAKVRASSEVEALRLDRSVFQALVRSHPELRHYLELHARQHHMRDFLRLHSGFAELPVPTLRALLEALEPLAVKEGERIVRQGEPPGPMFVVREGRLRAFRETDGRTDDVAYLRKGDFFGERSVLRAEPYSVTVEAVSDCELLRLPRAALEALLAEQPRFRERIEERVSQYDYQRVARVPLDFAEEVIAADSGVYEIVGLDQVEEVQKETPGGAGEEPSAQVAAWDERFRRPERRIRRFPHVWQVDEMDCGAACVAMLTRHFGRAVSLAHIRRVVHTGADGTSLLGIAKGAEDLGLAAHTLKASKSRLDELPLPAVIHWEGTHWVVLYDVADGHVKISDPARGRRRMSRAEFDKKWSGYATLVAYTEALEETPETRPSVRWILEFFRPHRGTLARALVLALLSAGLLMLIPVFGQVIVDRVVDDRDTGLLTLVVLGMLAAIAVGITATVLQRYLLSRMAVQVDTTTLDHITSKLLALPMSYFLARRTGDIERRLLGMQQVRTLLVQHGVQGITAAMQVAVALALMFIYSWTLALVYLATIPLYAGLMIFSRRRLRPMFDSLEESWGRYLSRQIDAVRGMETVKAMGGEESLRKLMLSQFRELSERRFRADFTIMVYEGAIQAVTFLSLALFLWIGALEVMDGSLSVGGFVAVNALVLLANAPINTLVLLWDESQRASVLLNRLNDIVEQEPEQGDDHSRLRAVKTLAGKIQLRNLGFDYGGAVSVPVLEGITLEVEPGTTVAIVGRSGSGKTTLVKCLSGLLEPAAGAILYDGVDLRELEYRDLRRKIGFVLQENHLFNDTIARNIAFGSGQELDMERVLWAARVAAAHEFIERLPLGYETRIGETGLRVSGGQAQRIAIARAVYNRPPILIFDEATSSLDTESERAVQENLDRLLEGRTSFVIAHRLSTVRHADLIVVLEKGKLVERGTHDELMGRQGIYYYLVSQQLGV